MKTVDESQKYDVYVQSIGNNEYYFDRHILDNFDMKKEYVFEVESTDKRNTTTKKVNITLGSKNLGLNANKYEISTEGEKLKFTLKTYVGEPNIELKELTWGKIPYDLGYIYGKIVYKEKVNGTLKSSTDKPTIVFKATDGSLEKEVYVQSLGNDTYYFDRHIFNSFDKTKEYVFEIKSGDIRNTYNTKKTINLGTRKLTTANEYRILTKDNKVYFEKDTYNGAPNAELKKLNVSVTNYGSTYIYGNIEYTELINNVKTQPRNNPIIEFKSTDGQITKEVYVDKINSNTFYFDRHLEGIDTSKQYEFVVRSGSSLNTNKNTVTVKLGNKNFGLNGNYSVNTENTKVYMKHYKDQYKGIDVSKYNGDIDWKKVKQSGIDFAILRVGFRGYETGKIVFDNKFKENANNAASNKIAIGAYFVTQATNYEEGKEEANQAITKIKESNVKVTYPIVVDIEWAGGGEGNQGRADYISVAKRTEAARGFCETIKNAGYTPMIYANKYWLTNFLDMSKLTSFDVWLAHYVSGAPTKTSDYKGKYAIWQYTSSGSVSGITGNVDIDISYKTY